MSAIALYLRTLLGDGRYSMLREREIVQQGYEQYADLFRNTPSPRNILLGCPEYCNLGDHAIAYAQQQMLERTGRPILVFSGNMVKLLGCLREFVTPEDVIFLQGGGNMGSLYWQEECYRCDIISLLPHNKIILFPQTISYDDTPESQRCLKHTQHVYGRHHNLHLIARETVSYNRMREYYPNNDIRLTPDIVLSLTTQATADPAQRNGVLLCMRNDVEKTTSDTAQHQLEAAVTAAGESWAYTDTTVPDSFAPISKEHGEELVLSKFDEFRKARLVITDRLHGMIFSTITGTPCIAMNNSNGKVGFEYQWLTDFPYIHFANNTDEAIAQIPSALKTQTPPETFKACSKVSRPSSPHWKNCSSDCRRSPRTIKAR